MNSELARLTGMSPEQIQQLINIILTFIAGMSGALIIHLRSQINLSKKEREAAIEQLRSDMNIKEREQVAQQDRDKHMFELIDKTASSVEKLADAIRDEGKESREIERENEKDRKRSYDNNTAAIIQLKDVLETQSERFQQTDIILQDVATKAYRADKTLTGFNTRLTDFDTRLTTFLDEVKVIVEEYNDSFDSHTKSESDRHNKVIKQLEEIIKLLTPPPKEPLILPNPNIKKEQPENDNEDTKEKAS